ncbi:MAG: chitobiase/beta-hexosaminidase C-terminal domain-containing protein [Armatimonadota bacterium]
MKITIKRARLFANLSVIVLLISCQSLLAQVIDRNGMTNKVLCGYQGWFLCPGDGMAEWWGWNHWSKQSTTIGPGTYNIEVWPDTREYNASDLFAVPYPGTILTQGGLPYLFSSARQGATNVHFRWMQENGIDGVFHQVFVGGYNVDPNDDVQRKLDTVLQNVMNASTTYGRTFAVEYDISGVADADIYNKLTGHWTYVNNAFNVKNHSRYLYHNGKPVVIVWGLGFNDTGHPGTTATASAVIQWFKDSGCFIIGGVPGKWRTGDGDSRSGWASTYAKFDGVTPWTVGRYKTSSEITTWKSRVSSDISLCNNTTVQPSGLKQLYMPTAWPRFGWDNMNNYPAGQSDISSRGGQHLWDQVYAWKSVGATCQFIAMFDEYDEGTAIMKLTDNVPTTGSWFTTEGKGEDWWLRLVNYAGKMQRGEISTSQTIPVNSATSPDNAQMISNTIPTTMVALQEYDVSVTVKNTGETCWNAEFFKLGALGESDPFTELRQKMPSGTAVMPNGQYTFSFRMTAPATPGSYTTDWQMVHEVIRWFGGTLSVPITVTSGPDTIAPRSVASLTASPGTASVNLEWQNSPSPDTTGTMVRFSTTGYPGTPTDGTLVVDKSGTPGVLDSFSHTPLAGGVTYYYSAFAHDAVPNYAPKATALAVLPDSDPPTSSADKSAGVYKSPLIVQLSANEPGTIFYTTNGSEPTAASSVYAPPLSLTTDTTVRFYAVDTAGNPETTKHTESYRVVSPDGSIGQVKAQSPGSAVRLADKYLYWKSGTLGYIEDKDRANGIRVFYSALPAEGTVCLTGTLQKISANEFRIVVDAITRSGSETAVPLGANINTLKLPLMSGLFVRAWGMVLPNSIAVGSFFISDGSDESGLKMLTAGAPPVVAGQLVSVTGPLGYIGMPVIYAKDITIY